ncbi:ABC transporter permease [Brevibacillus composti]|uniref:ABC transporter permease n=1 Tax=Brevibacillus composti TaxID=2796470 RepID=A0ABX7Z8I3_9BACL|nr:ABC transporter permease [Brevibacillus composti]QUO43438.1 ABC transporter permease [Brevibacillus composti]
MQTNLTALVDEAIALERKMKEDKKRLDAIKAELTTAAYAVMDNRNLSFLQIFGSAGHFNAVYKEKFEIDNYERLIEVLGDVARSKIIRKEEVKYDTESRFKAALIALYKGDYSKDISIDEVLRGLGLSPDAMKAVKKKLKGEYLKDKKLLETVGVQGDLEEELDAIRLAKNAELIERFFGQLTAEQIDDVKKSIFVEESISVGLEYAKEDETHGNAGSEG